MTPPVFFSSASKFRAWLERNHGHATELSVGYYRVDSGKPSMTWPDSVDEALSFGWIDGVRRSLDSDSYTIRFTPRTTRSIWSKVNIAKVESLIAQNRMAPAGLAAFARRDHARSGIYSFERETTELDADLQRGLRKNPLAWRFFQAQPPSYRKVAAYYVVSAKRADTRARRLTALIKHSAKGERLPQYVSAPRSR
jgi:uncharacterized protein YdeI (YjbR/CyaY-like superfamily)